MTRRTLLAVALVAAGGVDAAAVDPAGRAAVDRGVAYLRGKFANGVAGGQGAHALGESALAGLAMLEGDAPATDPTVQALAKGVRELCLPDQQTYQVALCVLFLDRLGDPSDRGLIQVLGVKLYAGMTTTGGWAYTLDDGWTGDVASTLSALQDTNTLRTKPGDPPKGAKPPGGFAPPPPKKADEPQTGLHPLAERMLKQARAKGRRNEPGDNSNTQFGLIGLWVAARNGLPVDDAFGAIERRFLTSQTNSGWAYTPGVGSAPTASMTCAGLRGRAVGAGRSSATPPDRRGPQPRPEGFAPPPAKKEKDDGPNLETVKNKRSVAAGLAYLAACVRQRVTELGGLSPGGDSYYVLWSIERVCMAYSVRELGGVDWYQWGVDFLLPNQRADGSWPAGNLCSAEVDTCFAILFLMKSNVVSDLSKLIKPQDNVMRAGDGLPPPAARKDAPKPAADANPLVAASDADFPGKLAEARDTAGGTHTKNLADAIPRLTGDRQAKARQALADRLTRMKADTTLRAMLRDPGEELKRAAAVAAGVKGDKVLLPDLANLVTDPAEAVVQAAREALKKLTGADHGPPPGADAAAKAKAQADWRAAIR